MKYIFGLFALLMLAFTTGCKDEEAPAPTIEFFNVDYILDGGINSESNPTKVSSKEEYKLYPAHKDGYAFNGWYTSMGFHNSIFSINYAKSDLTIYAKFSNNIEINYHLFDGINSKNNPATLIVGSGIFKLEPAYKKGYSFMGWYLDSEFTNSVEELDTDNITSNIDLYARYDNIGCLYEENEFGYTLVKYFGNNEEFTIPNKHLGKNVTKVGESAFEGAKIKKIIIPAEIEEFGNRAFYNCNNLASIEFEAESNLRLIGREAFSSIKEPDDSDNRLRFIGLPDTVEYIGENAFDATYPRYVFVENEHTEIKHSMLTAYYKMSLEDIFEVNGSYFVVENGQRVLVSYDYERNSSKGIRLEIDESIDAIGTLSIYGLTIDEYNFNNVVEIRDKGIANCEINTKLLLEETKIKKIGYMAFNGITSKKTIFDIVLPADLKSLADDFIKTDLIVRVVSLSDLIDNANMPEAIIYKTTKDKYFSARDVVIVEDEFGVKTIVSYDIKDNDDYYYADKLGKYAVSDVDTRGGALDLGRLEVKSYPEACIYNTKANGFIVNQEVEVVDEFFTKDCEIEYAVFAGIYCLQNYWDKAEIGLKVKEGTNRIEFDTYSYAPSKLANGFMKNYSSPVEIYMKSISVVGAEAFMNANVTFTQYSINNRNQNVNLRNAVYVGDRAFYNVPIEFLTLNENCRYVGKEAFKSTTNTYAIIYSPDNDDIQKLLGAFVNTSDAIHFFTSTLNFAPTPELKELLKDFNAVSLRNATNIDGLFENHLTLNKVYFQNLTQIPDNAFKNCINLDEISLVGDIEVGEYAFDSCRRLSQITPFNRYDTVKITKLSKGSFKDCESLTSFPIISEMRSIPEECFMNCVGILSYNLYLYNIEEVGARAFKNTKNSSFYFSSNLKFIGEGAFEGCDIASLELPFIGMDNDTPYTFSYLFGADSNKDIVNMNISTLTILNDTTLVDGVLDSINVHTLDLKGIIKDINENTFKGLKCNKLIINKIETALGFGLGISQEVFKSVDINYSVSGEMELPKGVESIGGFVFKNNRYLTKITLPSTVKSIGAFAFYGCSNLESINLPEGLERIEDGAFEKCDNLKSVELPDSLVYLGKSAFESSGINTIKLPDSLTKIEASTFRWCYDLSNVTLSSGLIEIGDEAFRDCYSLEEINIPASVKVIGFDAFYLCSSLKRINAESLQNWCKIDFKNNHSNPLAENGEFYTNGELVTKLEITADIEEIKSFTFYNCSSIKEITFNDGIKSLGEYSLALMKNLVKINIPVTLTSFGEGVFYQDINLTEVYVANVNSWFNNDFADFYSNPLYYADKLFSEQREVKNLTVPSDIDVIKKNLFVNFYGLESIETTGKITKISDSAFYGCKNLRSISLNDNVEEIGNYAFNDCNRLEKINHTSLINKIGDLAFYNCTSLKEISFDGVSHIGRYAFSSCHSLTNLVIGKNIVDIDDYAFYDCRGLKTIVVPNEIKSFGIGVFANNESLMEITTPNYKNEANPSLNNNFRYFITDLDNEKELNEIIPTSLVSISLTDGELIVEGEFNECDYLTNVALADSFKSISKRAFYNCDRLKEVILPDTITYIGEEVFLSCKKLTKINIPTNVEEIGYRAFYNCTEIATVELPSTLRVLGNEAFRYCSKLTAVTMSDGLEAISKMCFESCESLTSIKLPSNLHFILDSAFEGCKKLVISKLPDEIYSLGSNIFKGCSSITSFDLTNINLTLIPEGLLYNCDNLRSVILNDNFNSIGKDAFSGCTKLASINVPAKLISIRDSAFYDCRSLTSFDLTNVTVIEEYAFKNCRVFVDYGSIANLKELDAYAFSYTKISSVVIPEAITKLSNNLFDGCESLNSVTLHEGITNIGEACFKGTSIVELTLLSDVNVGRYAFAYCNKLETIDGSRIKNISSSLFEGAKSLKEFTIRNGVEEIESSAFKDCVGINVLIPNSVKKIYDYSFRNTQMEFKLPDSLEKIGTSAFENADFNSITLPSGCKAIGENAFKNNKNLTSVILNNGLMEIDRTTFIGCSKLEYNSFNGGEYLGTIDDEYYAYMMPTRTDSKVIEILSTATVISYSALNDCKSINELTTPFIGANINSTQRLGIIFFGANSGNYWLPESLYKVTVGREDYDSIAYQSFYDCRSLRDITLTGSFTELPNSLFEGSLKLSMLTINAPITKIGNHVFKNCSSLTSFEIQATVTSIGSYVFESSGVTKLDISGIESIANNALYGATKLRELKTDYDGPLKNILGNQFLDITKLVYLGSTISYKNFDRYSSFSEVYVSPAIRVIEYGAIKNNHLKLNSFGGGLYLPSEDNPYYALVDFDRNATEITYHKNMKIIASDIDYTNLNPNLGAIKIADGIEEITSLYSIQGDFRYNLEIPSSARIIKAQAFMNNSSIRDVKINEGLLVIEEDAFKNSTVTNISIPNSLVEIRVGAFNWCSSLSFNEIDNVLYLGNSENKALVAYELRGGQLQDGIKFILNGAIRAQYESLTIPKSVIFISKSAFSDPDPMEIAYEGTKEEFSKVKYGEQPNWSGHIVCSDGVYEEVKNEENI